MFIKYIIEDKNSKEKTLYGSENRLISNLTAYKTITLCGSMTYINEMEAITEILSNQGKKIFLPQMPKKQINYNDLRESKQYKLLTENKNQLMHTHFDKIKESDAVLIYNEEKKGIPGYVGANTLIEIAYAYFLHKPILLLNPYDANTNRDEIAGMKPTVINL